MPVNGAAPFADAHAVSARPVVHRLHSWARGVLANSAVLVMVLIVATLVLPPAVVIAQRSLTESNPDGSSGALTLGHFTHLFGNPLLYSSAWHSILFAAMSTAVTLLVGGSIAWLVERTNTPLKWLAYVTTVVSMGTPYLLYVMAWLFLGGKAGPLNDLYRSLMGTTESLIDIYTMSGMILVEGLLWSPLVFLMLSASFRAANAEMEEAARMSGASVLATIRHVSLPLARPAVLAMGLFLFIRNLESFDVPVLIGTPGRINLLTTDVYLSVSQAPPDLGHASAYSMVLIALVSILLYYYGRISRMADRYASVTGKGYRPRPFDLGRWRWLGGMLVAANFLVVLALPMAALLWMSLMPFLGRVSSSALRLLTLDNYAALLNSSESWELASNTIIVSAAAATVAMLLTVIAGWLAARRRPGGAVLDQLTTVPLVFPGIVLGVALIEMALRLPFGLYGTLWIIIIAFVIRYMPYGMRYAYSGVLQIHRELEEAAGACGASRLQSLRRVVAPLLSPAIIAGWLFIFLIGAKELSLAILLAGPGSQTMAVAMFDLWQNGQAGEVSALGLVWSLFMTVCALSSFLLMRRHGVGAFGK